ncbi:MAG TPA: anti-sigma factor [Kofleriaceae bacterium]|jgi:hypothetical protein
MLRLVGFTLVTSLWLVACTNSGGDQKTVTISASTLPALGSGYDYEGWFITPGGPESTGRFTVDGSGNPTPATSQVDTTIVDAATAAVITIEPANGGAGPSSTHIVGGALAGGAADLVVSYTSAVGTDFSSAAGTYILATPSTASDATDNDQGIWWLVPPATQGGSATPGLTLPTLPAGWMYEGWVASATGPVSTGKFTSVSGADADGAGPTAGPDAGPPFPGEDFIDPAMVLTSGFKSVITVEPDPDDSTAPFGIKALIADPIGTQTAPTSLPMSTQGLPALPTAHIAAS